MRRSRVRLLFQASISTLLGTVSYEGFFFSTKSLSNIKWHTHGTLNHKSVQEIIELVQVSHFPIFQIFQRHEIIINFVSMCRECAIDRLFIRISTIASRKTGYLFSYVIALCMRCCCFWSDVLHFRKFYQEINT